MNYDEFAFFNQQLGAMLREGLPLEGALRELSAGMKDPSVRVELQQLEADLSKGTSFKEALARRNLPPLFVRMVQIGASSNDLPGVLTLLADHYHRVNSLWTRLKGLMVYPLLIIFVSLGLTATLAVLFNQLVSQILDQFLMPPWGLVALMWLPPVVMAIAGALGLGAIWVPAWRARLRWRLPAFREASLAQTASSISLMLRNGIPLPEAFAMAEVLESGTPAAPALAQWRLAIEAGKGKPSLWTDPSRAFPPLFVWLVQKSGENVAAGFQKAAEIYQARAAYRTELALYGALPVSILFLGQMVFWQVAPILRTFIMFMNMLGGSGD